MQRGSTAKTNGYRASGVHRKSDTEDFLEGAEAYPSELAADFSKSGQPPKSALIGKTIGKYKILELIGHGGMGSVFLTERTDGAYDKKVALKLLRSQIDFQVRNSR